MWTLTEVTNAAARATYRRAGATTETADLVMPEWTLGDRSA